MLKPDALQAGKSRLPLLIALAVLMAAGAATWLLWPEPEPLPRIVQLADGTEAFHYSDSDLTPAAGYPQPRELLADGEFFLKAAAHPEPLTVRTRLLVLTVTGETAMRIVANHHEAGEQVEVLYGHVVARKSYPSNYSEPDTLEAGGMVLINKDIDLMEKEKCDIDELRAWSENWVATIRAASAAPGHPRKSGTRAADPSRTTVHAATPSWAQISRANPSSSVPAIVARVRPASPGKQGFEGE